MRLSFGDLLRLRGGAQRRKRRIWHARRNNEMLVGVAPYRFRSAHWRRMLLCW
jgi:hypothetical protein